MEDIFFSRQQFDALMNRLDDIRNNVSGLKLKTQEVPEYIEAHDIIRLYHISKRTLERWRQIGRIPFNKVGNFFYYNKKDILGQFRLKEKEADLNVPVLPCLTDMEILNRHRKALLTKKNFKVPNFRRF